MALEEKIETTFTQIQKVMDANSIVGNAISTKDKIIIPISKVALGFGVGTVNNQGTSTTEVGGAGGGGSIDPVAFLIIYNNIPGPDGVELVPLDAGTPVEDLLSNLGKFAFDMISGKQPEASDVEESTSSIDKIKTKIKPESNVK
ncbi:MAG: hypothetical protein E7Z86_09505 [Methanosphaera stadtmanae]|jgi:uncharacterized spore protein YtfJ|nr:hypothetical protein [Methanosphaera stadtmanae]